MMTANIQRRRRLSSTGAGRLRWRAVARMLQSTACAATAVVRLGLMTLLWAAGTGKGQMPPECYRVETVATPEGIAPEVSAIAFTGDGLLAAAFRRGHIYLLHPATGEWKRFASGLQTPLGILPGGAGELFVAQLPELTRVADTDGDGAADTYETLCDAWGLAGNYHEFVAGPVRDVQGNFYISLGLCSGTSYPKTPVRGLLHEDNRQAARPRADIVSRLGQFSPVPYRGWVVRISPDGNMHPVSAGLRQPNGLVLDAHGELFVVDNQGDWVGTSPLHHVTPGAFHGHPASLNWDRTFPGDPVESPIEIVRQRRKMPAVQFPQGDLAGSLAQPVLDSTRGQFGPYAGQLFVAEWTYPRIHRVVLEKVGGQYQGACFSFLHGNGLRAGNGRLAFAPDGSLYVAQTSRGWGANEGLQRVVWSGNTPMDILDMRLTKTGFELTFTKPLDPASAAHPAAYSFTRYFYLYQAEYGSPKMDVAPVKVLDVSLSKDGQKVRLALEPLVPGRIYELRPRGLKSGDGQNLVSTLGAYTLNRLIE